MIDPDAFLRQEVESASPAKLRWLLIRKAVGLCQAVDQLWSEARFDEANQWLLRVREIFGELLAGVTDPENAAAQPVADLYAFLLKMLIAIEAGRDRKELQRAVEILQIELGTWELFVQSENQASGYRLDSQSRPVPTGMSDFAQATEWAGLNVEA